ncbi:hypothetical protein [Aureivirga sp. CE67]|uniref:hypothetical protein n=1 Tax=Aureivirga sp. CE67 TaxID=1788983 RepID=UPI0018CAAD61|nr:hypothetical protein [Aureivirga sp. CE67]
MNSFHKNFETGEKIKLNGVVKYDFEKVFYLNGVKVKIESYYDEECKILKERHEIFSTQIGSLDLNEISLSYNGKYEYWTKDGELSESGVYKMGNKVE